MFPDLVQRLVRESHEVTSHLDTQPHLTTYAQSQRHETVLGVTREDVIGKLRQAKVSFRAVTGRPLVSCWQVLCDEHNGEIRAWAAEG